MDNSFFNFFLDNFMLHYFQLKEDNLDIIIPCYNPLKDWHKSIVNSYNHINNVLLDTNINIILVNDGSKTGIHESEVVFIKQNIPSFTYLDLAENNGKGFALREGFKLSKSKFSIFTDIDFPYEEENLLKMYSKLKNGADVVLGIRNQNYYDKVPLFRKLLSLTFKKLLKLFFQIPTSDTQAGLKAFSNKGKQYILDTTTNRYLFDLELIKLAAKNKDIRFEYVTLRLKDKIILSKMSVIILLKEFKNLIKILFL
jgi:glycosyltransferase involved in cell wall biosynthesis